MAGRHIFGRDAAESVATLPVWASTDELREIYTVDTKKRYYGTDEGWKEYGGGGGSSEADIYSDLLGRSIYLNCSWDGFSNEDLTDAGNTTMDYDATNTQYDFTIGEILQSDDLYDPLQSLTITECMVSVDYTDSGTPTIQATADGTNWETVGNNERHTFTNTGTSFKIKFTAGGTGTLNSWAVLYNPDTGGTYGATKRKYATFYYEGVCQDEDIILDGFYFNNKVAIDNVTLHARVAPTGANLTVDLLDEGAEQSRVATLTDASIYEKTVVTTRYYESTERFGLKIKQIGSTEAGQGLTVTIHYYDCIN
jgi:hypothetical protein